MTKPSDGVKNRRPTSSDTTGPFGPEEPRAGCRRQGSLVRVLVLIAAAVVSVLLVKYALDVYLILVLLGDVAFVLHEGSRLVVNTELLSPA